MVYTEMVHATRLHHCQQQGQKRPQVMDIAPDENPISIQLFDSRPDFMAAAAQQAVAEGALTIDINMGCPVNKITRKGGGSALLRQPDVAVAIVKAVIQAVDVPVTVKTRLGWSEQEITILDFARRLQDVGIAMLTLHGRTRSQGYTGPAQWDWIAQVKAALSIPVIANGDIVSVESAIACLEQTGADGVMCSRGTLGYPHLVGEIDHFLHHGALKPTPTPVECLYCARHHLQALWDYKGIKGIHQARKHMAWYSKGFPGAAQLCHSLSRIESLDMGLQYLDQAIETLEQQRF
jgi:nifR3 family TIM-barrel protein